jgi:hypothetical protein
MAAEQIAGICAVLVGCACFALPRSAPCRRTIPRAGEWKPFCRIEPRESCLATALQILRRAVEVQHLTGCGRGFRRRGFTSRCANSRSPSASLRVVWPQSSYSYPKCLSPPSVRKPRMVGS